MLPKYFTRPECPDRTFFVCDSLRGEVSVEWCAKTWADVNNGARSKRWGSECQTISDRTCRRCPLGAQHAGVEFVPSAVVIDSKVCPRCRRPAERLIHGRLCVSCYNRDRERKIGRNAKGAKPKYLPCVHQLEVLARVKDAKPVVRQEVCVDGVEGMIATFRALGSLAAIAFRAKRFKAQPDLFEGL